MTPPTKFETADGMRHDRPLSVGLASICIVPTSSSNVHYLSPDWPSKPPHPPADHNERVRGRVDCGEGEVRRRTPPGGPSPHLSPRHTTTPPTPVRIDQASSSFFTVRVPPQTIPAPETQRCRNAVWGRAAFCATCHLSLPNPRGRAQDPTRLVQTPSPPPATISAVSVQPHGPADAAARRVQPPPATACPHAAASWSALGTRQAMSCMWRPEGCRCAAAWLSPHSWSPWPILKVRRVSERARSSR